LQQVGGLTLFRKKVLAMVSPPSSTMKQDEEVLEAIPVLPIWVRGILVVLALGLTTIFGIAIALNPYKDNGEARRMETHMQMGLPACTFKTMTGGYPCPSCGMTTSFSLLMHGDIWNSLKANFVGTLLALFWLALIPYCTICSIRGRPLFVYSLEGALSKAIVFFLILMFSRWGVVLLMKWQGWL
jgi:hypothetical protein